MIGRKPDSPRAIVKIFLLLRPSLTLGVLTGLWALSAILPAPAAGGEAPPVDAPAFSLQSLDGKPLTLEGYRGKYLLLNFWATWCGPCKVEMPSLEKLHRQFQGRNLKVLAVSNDIFGAQVVEPYIRTQHFTFAVGLDPKLQASNRFGVISLPTTFLIDPQGKIIGVLNGAENWADPKTLLYFDQLLSQPMQSAESPASGCKKDQFQPC